MGVKLMRSFLTDRKQFVSIDSFNSEIIKCLPCSIIQGSKMSSLLYSIYTNEIPVLNKLMNNVNYKEVTNDEYIQSTNLDIEQEIVNYVDDSSNLISGTNIETLQSYINKY